MPDDRKLLEDLLRRKGAYWTLHALADLVIEIATPKQETLAKQVSDRIRRAAEA